MVDASIIGRHIVIVEEEAFLYCNHISIKYMGKLKVPHIS